MSEWSRASRLLRLLEALERPADQPGDVHLRDADAFGDLRLREVLDEPQM